MEGRVRSIKRREESQVGIDGRKGKENPREEKKGRRENWKTERKREGNRSLVLGVCCCCSKIE